MKVLNTIGFLCCILVSAIFLFIGAVGLIINYNVISLVCFTLSIIGFSGAVLINTLSRKGVYL